jgi:hypothetical protein
VPVKHFLATVLVALSLAVLAACGSSGTHTQSLSPSAPDSSTRDDEAAVQVEGEPNPSIGHPHL